MKKLFITATDTDAGKTFVACAIAQALINQQKSVAVYKPVSAGCTLQGDILINEDADLLSQFSNSGQSITSINPIAFIEPIAPHIAAEKVNKTITLVDLQKGYEEVLSTNAEFIITEGAGGWRLPLDTKSSIYLSEFAKNNKQQVILVVNMKLGCLNHALLTYEAIVNDGLICKGWVANTASAEIMSNYEHNIESLEELLPIPKIAELSYQQDESLSLHDKISLAASQFNCTTLLA
jgi:dethiobiotin synthetase